MFWKVTWTQMRKAVSLKGVLDTAKLGLSLVGKREALVLIGHLAAS